jgi:hypothetical protein
MTPVNTKDLVVLVADKNMQFSIQGLLSRPEDLGMRPVAFDLYVHPDRDPGCRRSGHDFLRPFHRSHAKALLMFDRAGGWSETISRDELESEAGQLLRRNGWEERAAAIVIDPELEAWVWSDSPVVVETLGWKDRTPDLRAKLEENGFIRAEQAKPDRPKEALEFALRLARKQRSSSIYAELAKRVDFRSCIDPAFIWFREVLQAWFPA